MMSTISSSMSYVWGGLCTIPKYWNSMSYLGKSVTAITGFVVTGFSLSKLFDKIDSVMKKRAEHAKKIERRQNAGLCICECYCGNKKKVEQVFQRHRRECNALPDEEPVVNQPTTSGEQQTTTTTSTSSAPKSTASKHDESDDDVDDSLTDQSGSSSSASSSSSSSMGGGSSSILGSSASVATGSLYSHEHFSTSSDDVTHIGEKAPEEHKASVKKKKPG